jgi:hypothetical protein
LLRSTVPQADDDLWVALEGNGDQLQQLRLGYGFQSTTHIEVDGWLTSKANSGGASRITHVVGNCRECDSPLKKTHISVRC